MATLQQLYDDLIYAEQNDNNTYFDELESLGDSKQRIKSCNALETSLYEYFANCEESEIGMMFDSLFLIYLAWYLDTIPNTSVFYGVEITDDVISRFEKLYHTDIIQTSKDFANDLLESSVDEDYLYSLKRARNVSRNETDKLFNMTRHFDNARKYKYHIWNTKEDGRERKTHRKANKQKKPSNQPFLVGNSKLLFPKDTSLGADLKEIIACRCWETFVN